MPVPPVGAILCSRLVAEDRHKVRFLYREQTLRPGDSGWRVFSGVEDQAFADNVDNFGFYPAHVIATIDSDITPLLITAPPCAFERPSAEKAFVESKDFNFEPEA